MLKKSQRFFLYKQIYNLNKTLKVDFNISSPKLIISGINPHAGENGKIGIEEKEIIIYTDSRLVIKCATGEWKRRCNLDLWEEYDRVVGDKTI